MSAKETKVESLKHGHLEESKMLRRGKVVTLDPFHHEKRNNFSLTEFKKEKDCLTTVPWHASYLSAHRIPDLLTKDPEKYSFGPKDPLY